MSFSVDLNVVGLVAISVAAYFFSKRRNHLPLPPGPKKLPLLGNILDMPKEFDWETYHSWSKEYGSDIIHLSVAGTSIIVVNSAEAANDLFVKRSTMYSSRPEGTMIHDLMGWRWNVGFMPANDDWKLCRNLLNKDFSAGSTPRYWPQEMRSTHMLLGRLLTSHERFSEHLRHFAGALILDITYGIEALPKDDPYIDIAEKSVHSLAIAGKPGAFLVDLIPWLKYVPEWVPGAGFKKQARIWRALVVELINRPYNASRSEWVKGAAPPSFTASCLEDVDDKLSAESKAALEHKISATAATLYIAGADTTVASLLTFVLAMVLHPDVQKKAHEELDRVIGKGHLPDFNDESLLPYITAIVKETIRWKVVAPMAIPHFLDNEDVYKGCRMPAGSVVIGNSWAILHDENDYPDPYTFNPDRFIKDGKLNPDIKDPSTAAFGYGRRVCPGRFMVFSTLWIAIASILASFDITKAVDENGEEIPVTGEYFSGLASQPLPFKCDFKVRCEEVERLIQSSVHQAK